MAVPLAILEEAPGSVAAPELKRDVRRALSRLKAFARIFPLAAARQHLLRGRWLLLQGNLAAGAANLQAAVAAADKLQLWPDKAHAQLWLALSEAKSPDKRRNHLVEAMALFERCGHYHHSEIIRRGLNRPLDFALALESRV